MADDFEVTFHANEAGTGFTAEPVFAGDYDPGDLTKIDQAIRHMPAVVAYITKKAEEMRGFS